MSQAENNIFIKGARQHNLKNIDVTFNRNQLTVVTGVSGSGKSSLVFDTLYAEGQRRYVESLSSYARQFLERMNKPEVDYITGLSPAIAIEQKVNTRNSRSTVATTTEIYDYLKLLFTKAGKTISPVSGRIVKKHTVDDVVTDILELPQDSKVFILLKEPVRKSFGDELNNLFQKGFNRIIYQGEILRIEEALEDKKLAKAKEKELTVIVDRLVMQEADDDFRMRIADSVQTAFSEGQGECTLQAELPNGKTINQPYSSKFEEDGIVFEEPSLNFFSFNNPYGACKRCEGFGHILGIDEDLVVPDKSLSVYEGAVACWRGETLGEWKNDFVKKALNQDFPIHRPYNDLGEKELDLLWNGNKKIQGIYSFFSWVETQLYKIQYRVLLSKYRGRTVCPDCKGTRIRPDANYVKLLDTDKKKKQQSITDLVLMSIDEAHDYFLELKLSEQDQHIAERILKEIQSRLGFLRNVGLGYLRLNRLSNTLSGGESQRINLATSIGSSLVGSTYILDEPSIGLHSRDTENLIKVLHSLRDIGNTVVVVEHDEDMMKAADEIVDIGPKAGVFGGDVVFQGSYKKIIKDASSLTGRYLAGTEEIEIPKKRRKWNDFIEVIGAREHNLKNIRVKFPLGVMTVVTGVSGSGKTTLVKQILYPALEKAKGNFLGTKTGRFEQLEGNLKKISSIEMVDQNPIGKSSRSNPVTYLKAFDAIRDFYASQPLAKSRGFKSGYFSFNVEGGRCDNCEGDGEITIEMQFMADLHLPCEVCHGKRYKEEVLDITWNDKNIADVLDMSVSEALEFFKDQKAIYQKIRPLDDVGLSYVKLGQSSSTLSGGESQRIKLASFLGKGSTSEKVLFIFDEPTTGLHFYDIKKLMEAFNALIDQGHSIIIIEHNMDVIKCADWVIDLGPEGGDSGGHLVFAGTPEDLVNVKGSYTAKYLSEKMD